MIKTCFKTSNFFLFFLNKTSKFLFPEMKHANSFFRKRDIFKHYTLEWAGFCWHNNVCITSSLQHDLFAIKTPMQYCFFSFTTTHCVTMLIHVLEATTFFYIIWTRNVSLGHGCPHKLMLNTELTFTSVWPWSLIKGL